MTSRATPSVATGRDVSHDQKHSALNFRRASWKWGTKAGAGGAMRSLHVFMADRKLAWAARFNSAAPMVQVIDTTAATGEPVRYSLLSLPAYAVECLPRLAREMDAESQGA